MAEKTVLDFDPAENISLEDILYLIQGTGLDRDREVSLGAIISAVNLLTIDYIVDSDAKFQALCDGSISDATNVLVKAGTWEASAGSNWELNNTDTFRVIGEFGSILQGDIADTLMIGQAGASTTFGINYEILNITVKNINAAGNGFSNLNNMVNCRAEANSILDISGAIGYSSCFNLVNCYGAGFASIFSTCERLSNCGVDTFTNGFSSCKDISNAYMGDKAYIPIAQVNFMISCENISGARTDNASSFLTDENIVGFNNCKNISSCVIILTSQGTGEVSAITGGEYVSACKMAGFNLGAGAGYGFNNVDYVSACLGQGDSATGIGYGFTDCNFVYGCQATGSTSNYNNTNGVQTNSVLT